MKRLLAACIAALALSGAVAAQTAQAAPAPAAQNQQTLVKLSGKLELINGEIGIKADGTSYYAPQLMRLVGFVKDLQEGAAVKLEGYAFPIPGQNGYSMLQLTKLTLSGKDYDFSQAGGRGMRGAKGGGLRGGMMGGRGGMGGGPRW